MSTNFRTRMFGGFDREDVVAYIKKITQENQAQLEKLTQQNQALSQENDGLRRGLPPCAAVWTAMNLPLGKRTSFLSKTNA